MSLNGLTDILRQVRERFPALSKRINEAEALSRWDAVVGPIIAKHSRAIRVQERVLWVEVDHPIWKSELHHRKRQILAMLNGKASEKEQPLADLLLLDPRGNSAPRS